VTEKRTAVTTLTLVPEPEPFLDAHWLKPGSFTTMTELALPWLPQSMPIFDRIIIDDLEQEAKMSTPMVKAELVAGDLTGSSVVRFKAGKARGSERLLRFAAWPWAILQWQGSCLTERNR
jgi:hypothetical protein